MSTKPGNGFGVKTAADVNSNDPYKSYSDSVVNQESVWEALMTEAGRQAIGAQMAVPIRTQLDYVGTSRKFFEIDVLAQG